MKFFIKYFFLKYFLGNTGSKNFLVGYGKTPKGDVLDKSAFLAKIMRILLNGNPPVVIAPSMAGVYALELLMEQPGMPNKV